MITLDQSKIDAPDFPRPQEWWTQFLPAWMPGTVHDDGTVTIEVLSGQARYTGGPDIWYEPVTDKREAAAISRNREASAVRWLYGLPQLEPAIVEDRGEPCRCWRTPAGLHDGHCCFNGAKPVRICHQMPEDMRGPQGEIPPLVAS